jgi:hypothetical protein
VIDGYVVWSLEEEERAIEGKKQRVERERK